MSGETRSWRGLLQALVVTREILRCRNLADLMGDPAFARDAAVRRHILACLGRFAGMAHRRGFFHRDLKLRNILVQDFPAPDGKVFWIDCPKGGFQRFRRARLAAADLAGMEPLQGALRPGEWGELLAAYAAALRSA
jgi:tRNA A-37 threonylcarbamoyl transferase component Bud32